MTTVLADAYSRTAIFNTLFSSYRLVAKHARLVVRLFATYKYISFYIHKLETYRQKDADRYFTVK
jgi:hypothetical protein